RSLPPCPPRRSSDLAASSLNSFANWALDMPATSANPSSASPPSLTAVAILIIAVEIDEPPASALMPTDDSAADKPNTSDSAKPRSEEHTSELQSREN